LIGTGSDVGRIYISHIFHPRIVKPPNARINPARAWIMAKGNDEREAIEASG
jgi:hypothetical protein